MVQCPKTKGVISNKVTNSSID